MAQSTLQVSTGIIPPNTSHSRVLEILEERAEVRGYVIDQETVVVNTPRPGMKVAIATAILKEEAQ